MELLDNENKLVIIESIVQEICDLHQEMEDTKGAVMHDIGFQKQLRRALEAFYRYIPNKNKYNWGGIAYYEISYGRKQFLRLNNPCELLKN
jgi:truncated hemoglobin YjbI